MSETYTSLTHAKAPRITQARRIRKADTKAWRGCHTHIERQFGLMLSEILRE